MNNPPPRVETAGAPQLEADDVIELDDEEEDVLEKWEAAMYQMMIESINLKTPIQNLLVPYKNLLEEESKNSVLSARLRDHVVAHIQYFNQMELPLTDSSSYYEAMEDVLFEYCKLELSAIRLKFKRRKKFVQEAHAVAQRMCSLLLQTFGDLEMYILHVLLRLEFNSSSTAVTSVMKYLFSYFLLRWPIVSKDTESFSRFFIVHCCYKDLLPSSEHVAIDEVFFLKHKRSPKCFTKHDVLKKIFTVQPRTLAEAVYEISGLRRNVVRRYFAHMHCLAQQRIREDRILNAVLNISDMVDEDELRRNAFGIRNGGEPEEIIDLDSDGEVPIAPLNNNMVLVITSDASDDEEINYIEVNRAPRRKLPEATVVLSDDEEENVPLQTPAVPGPLLAPDLRPILTKPTEVSSPTTTTTTTLATAVTTVTSTAMSVPSPTTNILSECSLASSSFSEGASASSSPEYTSIREIFKDLNPPPKNLAQFLDNISQITTIAKQVKSSVTAGEHEGRKRRSKTKHRTTNVQEKQPENSIADHTDEIDAIFRERLHFDNVGTSSIRLSQNYSMDFDEISNVNVNGTVVQNNNVKSKEMKQENDKRSRNGRKTIDLDIRKIVESTFGRPPSAKAGASPIAGPSVLRTNASSPRTGSSLYDNPSSPKGGSSYVSADSHGSRSGRGDRRSSSPQPGPSGLKAGPSSPVAGPSGIPSGFVVTQSQRPIEIILKSSVDIPISDSFKNISSDTLTGNISQLDSSIDNASEGVLLVSDVSETVENLISNENDIDDGLASEATSDTIVPAVAATEDIGAESSRVVFEPGVTSVSEAFRHQPDSDVLMTEMTRDISLVEAAESLIALESGLIPKPALVSTETQSTMFTTQNDIYNLPETDSIQTDTGSFTNEVDIVMTDLSNRVTPEVALPEDTCQIVSQSDVIMTEMVQPMGLNHDRIDLPVIEVVKNIETSKNTRKLSSEIEELREFIELRTLIGEPDEDDTALNLNSEKPTETKPAEQFENCDATEASEEELLNEVVEASTPMEPIDGVNCQLIPATEEELLREEPSVPMEPINRINCQLIPVCMTAADTNYSTVYTLGEVISSPVTYVPLVSTVSASKPENAILPSAHMSQELISINSVATGTDFIDNQATRSIGSIIESPKSVEIQTGLNETAKKVDSAVQTDFITTSLLLQTTEDAAEAADQINAMIDDENMSLRTRDDIRKTIFKNVITKAPYHYGQVTPPPSDQHNEVVYHLSQVVYKEIGDYKETDEYNESQHEIKEVDGYEQYGVSNHYKECQEEYTQPREEVDYKETEIPNSLANIKITSVESKVQVLEEVIISSSPKIDYSTPKIIYTSTPLNSLKKMNGANSYEETGWTTDFSQPSTSGVQVNGKRFSVTPKKGIQWADNTLHELEFDDFDIDRDEQHSDYEELSGSQEELPNLVSHVPVKGILKKPSSSILPIKKLDLDIFKLYKPTKRKQDGGSSDGTSRRQGKTVAYPSTTVTSPSHVPDLDRFLKEHPVTGPGLKGKDRSWKERSKGRNLTRPYDIGKSAAATRARKSKSNGTL